MINSILGPLTAKQQKRLLKKQYHQLSKRHRQSIKNKCLQFTFPISYSCPIKYKKNHRFITSDSSLKQPLHKKTTSQLSNNINRLKSAVSISFIDEKSDDMSIFKNSKQNHSSSLLNIPSKKTSIHRIRSSNAYIQKHSCQSCGSILSNGICSCIVSYLLQMNNTKENDILVQLNDIFENLTSNNIIM